MEHAISFPRKSATCLNTWAAQNVRGDGRCGYRALTLELGLSCTRVMQMVLQSILRFQQLGFTSHSVLALAVACDDRNSCSRDAWLSDLHLRAFTLARPLRRSCQAVPSTSILPPHLEFCQKIAFGLDLLQVGGRPRLAALPAFVGGGSLSTPASAASEVPAAASARARAGLSSQCLTQDLCVLQTRTGLHVPRRQIPASLGQHLPARGVERRRLLCPGLAPPGLRALPSAA